MLYKRHGALLLGDAAIEKYRLIAVAVGLLVFAVLAWTLSRTKVGLLIRAGVQDREMVESLGYRIKRLFVGVFVAGSALAGLGGVLGAVVGSQVGRSSSDACRSYQSSYGSNGYYAQGYSQPSYGYYDDRYTGDQGYRYDDYDRRDDYAYSRGGYYDDRSRPVESYQNSDGCRLAESQIRLPDGRTDTRYVRTCPDQYGRYRVVD